MGFDGEMDMPGGDAELTRAAQRGEVAALGLLLERHEAGMRAVALSIPGPGPDAEDAVQGAALIAPRGIADVRDPAAVGPWLRMIVRNRCRGLLRDARPTAPLTALPPNLDDPQQWLERHALRDWVWEAMDQLSPTLRLPFVLRHFSDGLTSYERIAEICAVPVGTVRSRLNQGRSKLAAALTATAAAAHSDARRRTEQSLYEARETLAEAERGHFGKVIAERWSPDVTMTSIAGRSEGRGLVVRAMDCDLAAGTRQRPAHVVASRDLIVWEMALTNLVDPDHCPPAVAWIMHLRDDKVSELGLHHPSPPRAFATQP
jgi:RNA polymerase sigma-70 factor (ECF subfamily)